MSPLLMGGALGWAIGPIAGASALALGFAFAYSRALALDVRISWPLVAVTTAWAFTALQLVPLPAAVTAALSQETVEHVRATATVLDTASPTFIPLSLDPGSTREELVKGAAIVSAFIAAFLISAGGEHRRVLRLCAYAVVGVSVVTIAHALAGAERVFGVYTPDVVHTWFVSPLLNANNLAGFMAMGVPLLLGLALDEEDGHRRILWLIAAAVAGATGVMAGSRGGMVALAFGGFLFGCLIWWRRRKKRIAGTVFAIAAVVGASVLLGFYVASSTVFRELGQRDVSKLRLAADALVLSLDQPATGFGRGAFSVAFVSRGGVTERYVHAENLLAQWAVDWGVPIASFLVLTLAAAWLARVRRARSFSVLGACAAVATITAHNMVDLGLELVGIAIVAASLLGALFAPERLGREVERPKVRLPRASACALTVLIAATTTTVALGPSLSADSVRSLQHGLTDALLADDGERFDSLLQQALMLHPAEPVFPLLAAERAVRTDDRRAGYWLNRAMELAPHWWSPRLIAARWLLRRGRVDQAMLEIREAEHRRAGSGVAMVCALLSSHPRVELATEAAPRGGDGGRFLDQVASCPTVPPDLIAALDQHAAAADPSLIGPQMRTIQRLAREGQLGPAERDARAVTAAHPEDPRAWLVLAHVNRDAGDLRQAIAAYDRAKRLAHDPTGPLREKAAAEAALGDMGAARETLAELRGRGAGNPAAIAAAAALEAQLERQAGNDGRAMRLFEDAHRMDPAPARLREIAQHAERIGDYRRALTAYGDLCRVNGASSEDCAARDRAQARLVEPPRLDWQPTPPSPARP